MIDETSRITHSEISVSPETTFEQTAALEIIEAGQGFVVYDDTRDRVHFLNATAAIIYALCEGGCSFEDIVHELGQGFALEESPTGEVGTCLKTLEAEQLIRRRK